MFRFEARPANRLRTASAATLVAATLLIGSAVPTMAMWSATSAAGPAHHHREHSTFHRHFFRGQATHTARADLMPVASEADMMAEAEDYCGTRFKSYDPTTGTYLGYDGYEHACP